MHLFARVGFNHYTHLNAWKEAFPDPAVSPAHYTRFLVVDCPELITVVDTREGGLISTFSNVERLELWGKIGDGYLNLVPFHNFSPALKSLRLMFRFISPSKIFNLICSLPLLEDLNLDIGELDTSDEDGTFFRPSTSPPLTGTLTLNLYLGERYLINRLLDLPNGLHFRSIVCRLSESLGGAAALVEGCSDTLEHVHVGCYTLGELLPF